MDCTAECEKALIRSHKELEKNEQRINLPPTNPYGIHEYLGWLSKSMWCFPNKIII